MNQLFAIILLCISCLLISCSGAGERHRRENRNWHESAEAFIRDRINKPVLLPDSVSYMPQHGKEVFDSVMNSAVKILFNVDIDCSTCLIKFNYWSNFVEEFYERHKVSVPILSIINSSMPEVVEQEVGKYWEYGWIYDSKYAFLDKNMLHDDRFQAVLLDGTNSVLLIGNPMHNKVLSALYEESIWNILQKKENN